MGLTTTAQDWLDALHASGWQGRKAGSKRWRGPCPVCGGEAKSRRFWVEQGDVQVLAGCNKGCDFEALAEAVGAVPNGSAPAQPTAAQRGAVAETQRRNLKRLRQRWEEAIPLKDTLHPYLEAKGFDGPPPGLRTDGETLLVPMRDSERRVMGLQQIWGTRSRYRKQFQKGSQPSGTYFAVAPRQDSARIYIAEGLATGHTVALAMPDAAVVIAFTAGNLASVARTLRTKYPDKELVIAADNDRWKDPAKNPGVTAAKLAVLEVKGCQIAIPDFADLSDVQPGEKGPTDYDDLRMREGLDAVRRWLDPAMADQAVTEQPAADEAEAEPAPAESPNAGDDQSLIIIPRTSAGLETALNHFGISLRWNLRGRRMEFREGDGEWEPETDRYIDHLIDRVADRFKFKSNNPESSGLQAARFGLQRFGQAVNSLAYTRETDTFLDYLAALPEWDGIKRLDSLLSDLFHIPGDRELAAWASRFPYMGAVTRTLRPGSQLDETPVLIGGQGIGKSTACRLGLEDPAWFGDCFDFYATVKEQAEATAGCVIVEISEMVGSKRADIVRIRAAMTRLDDGQHRAAYARAKEPAPRRFVFVGTANDDETLPNDPHGNRRFVAVRIEPRPDMPVADIREYLIKYRDQLWAEALHRINAGEEARLPDRLFDKQAEVNEDHRHKDPLVEDALDIWLAESYTGPFKLADLIRGLNQSNDASVSMKHDSRRLSAMLTNRKLLKCKHCTCTGEQRTRRWAKPADCRKRS